MSSSRVRLKAELCRGKYMAIKKYFIAVVVLFFGAMNSACATKTTEFGSITSIRAFDSQAYVYMSGMDDAFGCASGGSDASSMVRFYWTITNADKLWSMLLAAQMSGKEVAFEGTCASGYLSVEAVSLKS